MNSPSLEYKFFISLLILVSLAFGWILLPFYGAVFWAVILAILFSPVQRRMQRELKGQKRNLSALLTLSICLIVAILPMIFITSLLVQEGASLYKQIEAGEIDFGSFVEKVKALLPQPLQAQLTRYGLDDLGGLREKITTGAMQGSQFLATKAFNIGQNTFQFILSFFLMLYLLFFLLRDGTALVAQMKRAIPLSEEQKSRLFERFARVARATVKGNIIVAVVQGALGGLIFAFMGIPSALIWGVVMAFLSLLPAVGAGLIWTPVAVYFLLTGSIWQGVVLTVYGIGVIGLVDNILRPILVGKDTKMPDYLVLMSTLGGLALFGLNGFVIGPLIAALFVSIWSLFSERETSSKTD